MPRRRSGRGGPEGDGAKARDISSWRARAIARETSTTLSATVADLVRRGLGEVQPASMFRSPVTGLMVVDLGRVVTSEDVADVEDDG